METYFTVVIPYSETPTSWHPTSPTGPFATLTRGAFASIEEATAWAARELEGQPFTVRAIDLAIEDVDQVHCFSGGAFNHDTRTGGCHAGEPIDVAFCDCECASCRVPS